MAATHDDPSAQLRASEPLGALIPPVPDAPAGAELVTGSEPTVLVIDDEQPIRTLLACLLEPMGYAVLGACDGHEALGLLRDPARRIDLVLLDVQLPESDGASVLRAIRRMRPGLPVVVQTGHAATELGGKLGGMAVEGVLEKPFHARNVIQLLERLCGQPGTPPD